VVPKITDHNEIKPALLTESPKLQEPIVKSRDRVERFVWMQSRFQLNARLRLPTPLGAEGSGAIENDCDAKKACNFKEDCSLLNRIGRCGLCRSYSSNTIWLWESAR